MSEALGLRVYVGCRPAAAASVLQVGWHDDADVPFRPGEDLPFEDSAVDTITIDDFVGELGFDRQAHLLLECRRALLASGLLHVSCADRDLAVTLRHLAALVGLSPARLPTARRSF